MTDTMDPANQRAGTGSGTGTAIGSADLGLLDYLLLIAVVMATLATSYLSFREEKMMTRMSLFTVVLLTALFITGFSTDNEAKRTVLMILFFVNAAVLGATVYFVRIRPNVRQNRINRAIGEAEEEVRTRTPELINFLAREPGEIAGHVEVVAKRRGVRPSVVFAELEKQTRRAMETIDILRENEEMRGHDASELHDWHSLLTQGLRDINLARQPPVSEGGTGTKA